MPNVVVISGHPSPGSTTLRLAIALGERIAASQDADTFVTVDVARLGPRLLTPSDGQTGEALLTVQDATLLIVATPALHAAFSGALKALLDQLPANALAGVLAIPVATADTQANADAAEASLARLLSELGADVVDFGLTAAGAELDEVEAVADSYTAGWLKLY